jgi:hypothetical protein
MGATSFATPDDPSTMVRGTGAEVEDFCIPALSCYVDSLMVRTFACFVLMLQVGCAAPSDDSLSCDDVSTSPVSYSELARLVVGPGDKSCSGCHNSTTAIDGYNFETPALAYDALSRKAHIVYGEVASGRMPDVGETWSEVDLQLLRSWYCQGAFYEP